MNACLTVLLLLHGTPGANEIALHQLSLPHARQCVSAAPAHAAKRRPLMVQAPKAHAYHSHTSLHRKGT